MCAAPGEGGGRRVFDGAGAVGLDDVGLEAVDFAQNAAGEARVDAGRLLQDTSLTAVEHLAAGSMAARRVR